MVSTGHTSRPSFPPQLPPLLALPSLGRRRGGHYLNFVPADSSFQRRSMPAAALGRGNLSIISWNENEEEETSSRVATNLIPPLLLCEQLISTVFNDARLHATRNSLLHTWRERRVRRGGFIREESAETLRQTLITLPSNH